MRAQQVQRALIRRIWELNPSGAVASDAINEAARRLIEHSEFATPEIQIAADLLRSLGIPPLRHCLPSSELDFVARWQGSFEHSSAPIDPPEQLTDCATLRAEPYVRAARAAESLWRSLPISVIQHLENSLTRLIADLYTQPYCIAEAIEDPISPAAFDREYPALGSLIDQLGNQWVVRTNKLLQRVHAEAAQVGETVRDICVGLSDAHAGGQTTCHVQFDNRCLYYKPRDVGLEAAWFRLAEWCNEHGASPVLPVLKVRERTDYGWVEAAKPAEQHHESTTGYFKKAGALAALGWAFFATDWHMGNIIATSNGPVLIDAETLLSTDLANHSLNSLGFLPRIGRPPYDFDVTGLGGSGRVRTNRRVPTWVRTSRGQSLEYTAAFLRSGDNIARRGDEVLRPADFCDSIAGGFEEMLRFLHKNRAAITNSNGPLHPMTEALRRTVRRSTRFYYCLMNSSVQVQHLHEPEQRREVMQSLCPDLTEEEVAALNCLDIPRFVELSETQIETIHVSTRIASLDQSRIRSLVDEIECLIRS